jgi:sigma-B regulation protein RsbQ
MDSIRNQNVSIAGAGSRAIIFAHGYGCDQTMWRFVTPAFAADYRLVLFDYPGHGGAPAAKHSPSGRHASLDGYATDVLDICQALDLHEAIFVGHSVSAMIGVLAAIREPERFSSLVLIGPSPRYINEGDYFGGFSRADIDGLLEFLDTNPSGWASTFAPVIMGNPDRPELSAELQQSFCRTDPEVAKHFARVTFLSDNRADLPKVTQPCLVVQVAQDAIAPVQVGEYVHRRIAQSDLVVLPTRGHCPHVSDPEPTIAAIQAFLQAHSLGRG